MTLRGYGRRATKSRGAGTFSERVERFGFVRLAEVPGRELVFGLAGRFWRPDGGLRRLTREEFLAFAEEGSVKVVWNLLVRESAAAQSEVSTETRILAFGAAARRKFRIYWTVIESFSGLTRGAMLRGIRRESLRGLGESPEKGRAE